MHNAPFPPPRPYCAPSVQVRNYDYITIYTVFFHLFFSRLEEVLSLIPKPLKKNKPIFNFPNQRFWKLLYLFYFYSFFTKVEKLNLSAIYKANTRLVYHFVFFLILRDYMLVIWD